MGPYHIICGLELVVVQNIGPGPSHVIYYYISIYWSYLLLCALCSVIFPYTEEDRIRYTRPLTLPWRVRRHWDGIFFVSLPWAGTDVQMFDASDG